MSVCSTTNQKQNARVFTVNTVQKEGKRKLKKGFTPTGMSTFRQMASVLEVL